MQDMLKECEIREILQLLLAGVPRKRFSKMLERYYSLYCILVSVWYGEHTQDCILTDFKQSEYKDGRKMYSFYGKNPADPMDTEDTKIDWNRVVLGEVRVYIPDCIDVKTDDEVLCLMVMQQLYDQCTVEIQKNTNKPLFEHIKSLPKEKKSSLPSCESLLERIMHYSMEKNCINHALQEYKESKCISFKWGDLLHKYEWEYETTAHVMATHPGKDYLYLAFQMGWIPKVYHCFYKLDRDNPPDVKRLYSRLQNMKADYEDIGLSDYYEVTTNGKKIMVESNACCRKLPLIYVRDDKGNKKKLDDVDPSELLCMDIRILDEEITKPEQVLALIGFYLEYPIRVERIQRMYFVQSLIGMKRLRL